MAFTRKLEFGNYTLKFGEDKVLLDLFDEIVMPSFLEMKFVRHLKDKGDYFFLDTQTVVLDPNPATGSTALRIIERSFSCVPTQEWLECP